MTPPVQMGGVKGGGVQSVEGFSSIIQQSIVEFMDGGGGVVVY